MRRPGLAFALTLLMLSGCGGLPEQPTSNGLGASEAADALSSSAQGYPAALVVRVTASTSDVQVRGVNYLGGAPLHRDAVFPMGSMTKSMTATLAGVLVQEGRIGWAQRVVEVLPELAGDARPEYADVTLVDLLAHRGGIFPATSAAELDELPPLSGSPTEQRLALTRWALQRAPSVPPRLRTEYSNGGYMVAAAMLERVTGQPYERLLQEKVFGPMGTRVQFGAAGEGSNEPWGHVQDAGGRWLPLPATDAAAGFPPAANPAGGAKLDGEAYARYLQMHLRALRGMPGEILSPATAARLHAVVQDGFALGWLAGQGLGGEALSLHNGSDDTSYYGLMAVAPSTERAAAVVVSGWRERSPAEVSAAVARLLR